MDDGYPPSQLPDDIDAQTASGADLPRPDTTLDPSLVGEYVTFERCPRYFIFKGQDRHESEFFHRERFDEAFRPLNPLLSKAGTEFEEHIEGELAPLINRKEDLDEADQSIESAQATLYRECQTAIERNIDDDDELSDTKPVALLQTPLKGRIGAWNVYGDADIILIWPANAGVRVRIIDIKSAKEQKTYHQIQTAIYTILFKQWVESRDDVAMDEVIIEGGVITRADDIDDACPEGIPEFSLSEREADIRSLCRHGGPLHRLYFTELEEADYTIEDKCAGCSYNEACHSDVIESRGLAMLGVSPGQQETLRQHNIETIDELAELRYQPEDEHRDPQAPTSPQVRRNHKETYRSLLNEPDIGASLSELIERAHYLSGRLTEHAANLDTGTDAKLLSRPSYSQLPDDDPREASDIDYPAMSLVRVYLNIQYDNLRDTLILASARITATASETDPIRISELVDPTPKDEDKIREAEREALERFVGRLGEGIEAVVDELDIEASDYDSTALHFYVFSRDERSNLLDTLDRHRDSERVDALKRLLDGRKGVDQPMLSTIRTAVWTRYGLRTPSPGLLHLFGQFGSRYSYSKPRYDWKYTPASKGSDDWADGETEVDLRQVFSWRLFATSVAYESDGDGYSLQPESQSSSDGDGLYPSRARYSAEIPLGYLWAAGGRIDEKWIEEADKQIEYDKDTLDAFRFHDPKKLPC
jgi:predicted RecB family nuclease